MYFKVQKGIHVTRFKPLISNKMEQFYYQRMIIKQFLKSVAAVNPARLISENLKIEKDKLHVCHKVYDITDKNINVVGFGKAVLGMAAQCEKILGSRLKFGVICGPQDIQNAFRNDPEFSFKEESVIQIHEGAENNLPDENAERGATEIISLVKMLDNRKDHLIVLISGGGSALLTKPKPGISLEEKRKTVKLLMESGADINELNTVRKKLSLVKGGGLASSSYPVPTTCLIISDVINDPIDIIASGPTVPFSDSDFAAFKILQKYDLENKVPVSVLLETKKDSEEIKATIENNKFPHVDNFIIGNNTKALDACKKYAEESGFESVILSNQVRGDAENVSDFYINMMFQILSALHNKSSDGINSNDFFKDCCFSIDHNVLVDINNIIKKPTKTKQISIIAGGEITIRVKGDGKGGRNQELALTTSVKVDNLKRKHPHLFKEYDVIFLFAGTDGQDGPTDAAGALGSSDIIEKARKGNIDFSEFLLRNDSYNFFSKIECGSSLVKIGYTGTNVMDVHIFLIYQKL